VSIFLILLRWEKLIWKKQYTALLSEKVVAIWVLNDLFNVYQIICVGEQTNLTHEPIYIRPQPTREDIVTTEWFCFWIQKESELWKSVKEHFDEVAQVHTLQRFSVRDSIVTRMKRVNGHSFSINSFVSRLTFRKNRNDFWWLSLPTTIS